jgi:hypothetical protein
MVCLGTLVALLTLSGCTTLPPACPAPADVKPEQLHGVWTVQLDGSGPPWTLQLGPHPEHQGSLRGELTQGTLRYPVVADLEGGEFTLEESHDGARIAATVVDHGRDDKIIVFKKKRRKHYKRKQGHRQGYTTLKIDSIG